MLKSMTGYGESKVEASMFVLAVEVKSVNNRFLKIAGKVPEEISYIQNELEECVRRHLARGSVYFTVRFTPTRFADLYEIDSEVLKKYLTTLKSLQSELQTSEEFLLKDLLLLPGVIRTEENLELGKEEVLPVALGAMEEAIRSLVDMRAKEGACLEEEFRSRTALLREFMDRVKSEAPGALEEHGQRLEERVNLLLSEKGVALGAQDVLKEVALLAERSDITEEIARFDSHLSQFVASLDSPQAVGRKLEFIVQEMVRESNTMGSKFSVSALNQLIVDIKAEVDRLKEQVMNVE